MIQTVSLDTARKLKDAGFRQDTGLRWVFYEVTGTWSILQYCNDMSNNISAPTTDELLAELPRMIKNNKSREWTPLRVYFGNKDVSVEYHLVFSPPLIKFANTNLCEALASMWLHLNSKGLLNGE